MWNPLNRDCDTCNQNPSIVHDKYHKKKNHFIPQMILKRHAFFHVPMREPLLFHYNKIDGSERLNNTEEVGKVKNLYTGKSDTRILSTKEIDAIENIFACYERCYWSPVLNKLESGNLSQLSLNEIVTLYLLITLQLLRTPEVLEYNLQYFHDQNTPSILDEQRYIKILSTIPLPGLPEYSLVTIMWKQMCKRQIVVYRSTSEAFILSENRPVLCLMFGNNNPDSAMYFFPVAAHMCIGLIPGSQSIDTLVDESWVKYLNCEIWRNTTKRVFSSEPITNKLSYLNR